MVFVDSIRGNMRRVVSNQVDSELLSLGFQYKMEEQNLFLVGSIDLRGEIANVTIMNSHKLYVEVYDYDECRWSNRYVYEFNEGTSLLGIVENAIQKENR